MSTDIDWTAVISDLKAFGLSIPQIAEKAAAPFTTINDLASGRSKAPRFALGVKLLQLHKEHVAADQASAGTSISELDEAA